jgi:hypothetical protein
MDNPETLTTLDTQETGRTMIDIALRRKPHYTSDDNLSATEGITVPAHLVGTVVSLLNDTNIIC